MDNVNSQNVSLVLYGLTVLGAAGMCVFPFLPRRGHQRWSKIAIVLMFVVATGFGVLAIVRNIYGSAFSHRALWRLDIFGTLLGGVWLGMYITLILAGQLICRRAEQLQDSK